MVTSCMCPILYGVTYLHCLSTDALSYSSEVITKLLKIYSPVIYDYSDWYVVISILEEIAAFILRVYVAQKYSPCSAKTLKMEAASLFEMEVFCSVWCNAPKGSNLHRCCFENLHSHIVTN